MSATDVLPDSTPTITIVVPAHNVAPYLDECIGSILGQSFADFELIIVDDGSSDDTLAVATRLAETDSRVSVYHQDQQGAGVARNTGMAHAQGRYLLFFDGDDVMEPTMLEELHRRAIETDADIAVCYADSFQDGAPGIPLATHKPGGPNVNAVYSGNELGVLLFSTYVGWPWDKLFRADFVYGHSLEFQNLSSTNDAFFVFTALALANAIALVPIPLAHHRVRNDSIETLGHKTPHNVYAALRAIEQRLKDEGVNEGVVQSCQNWGFYQLRWAMKRYAGMPEALDEIVHDYFTLISEHADDPDSFFLYAADRGARDMAATAKKTSMEAAAVMQLDAASVLLDETIEELRRVKAERDGYENMAEDYKTRVANFEHSPSFRLGRVLTAPARVVRSRIQKRKR